MSRFSTLAIALSVLGLSAPLAHADNASLSASASAAKVTDKVINGNLTVTGELTVGNLTNTELQTVHGVTSPLQAQIDNAISLANGKLSLSGGDLNSGGPATVLTMTGNWPGLGARRWIFTADASFWIQSPGGNGVTLGWQATSWATASDRRVKKDIRPLLSPLARMLHINGVNYRYRTDDDSAPLRVGVIAQDVREVLPEAVGEDKGVLNVRYTDLIPLVIEATKEIHQGAVSQAQEIESLKAENAQMKAYLCSRDPAAAFCK